ncbi:MAG TPA: carboxylesterase family protein [Steroidobacter sp.]
MAYASDISSEPAMRISLPMFVGSLCLSLASVAGASETRPQVHTRTGIVQGVTDATAKVDVYKGIPYAKPPTGDLRWRPPAPAPAWKSVRDARKFGHSCLQPPYPPTSVYFGDMASPSEDCLTLNVWAPSGAKKLPVMVWIHGGGLLVGSSSEPLYDGVKMAQQGIVVVSINYRLGLLGFFAHSALSAESEQRVSGNYGLLDQVEALRWVRDNVAEFGGDPSQVTIAGESAGGLSVVALLASPLARDLFSRAIVQSAYMQSNRALREETLGLRSAEAEGEALAKLAGASNAAALRAADPVKLFMAGLATKWGPEPVIDGVVLKRQLFETFAHDEQAKVPVIAGFNEGEIRSLLHFMPSEVPATQAAYEVDVRRRFGTEADAYLAVYPGVNPREDVMASIRDGACDWTAQALVRKQSEVGQPSYLYYFRHSTPAQRARDLAAFHASELPYIFGQVVESAALGPNWPRAPLTSAESQLSDAMLSYWVSFVREGVPAAANMPAWPRFTADERGYLDIDERPSAERDLHPAAIAFADKLIATRRQQGRGWRLDIGFSAFSVDEPAAGRQPANP